MIYVYLDKNIKAANAKELVARVPEKTFVPLKEFHGIPQDASCLVIHGVLRGNSEIIKQAEASRIPWVYMDNAGHYFPDMYKRITINGTAPTTIHGGKRFEHNTQFRPWRGGTGSKIIVLPPSPPYMDTFGARDFLNYLAHNVNIYTNKEIVIRAKPAKGKLAPDWRTQLKDAYAVITWGSALALDAMIQGVPTISLGYCPAKYVSFNLEDLANPEKLSQEPDRISCMDNLTWSCFRREELSMAWDQVWRNFKSEQFDDYNSYTDILEIK